MKHNFPRFENDPILIDKEVHKNEKEGKFNLGDNTTKDMLEFIQGHNTELDFSSDFQLVNIIILISSVVIVVVVVIIVASALMCNKRSGLRYENTNEYVIDSFEETDNGNSDENKITFEESK